MIVMVFILDSSTTINESLRILIKQKVANSNEQGVKPMNSDLIVNNDGSSAKDSCCFCSKVIKQKLYRHFKLVHAEEIIIREAFKLSSGKRTIIFKKLKGFGNYLHNVNPNCLDPIVLRRPSLNEGDKPFSDYLPCYNCLEFVSTEGLRHHQLSCIGLNSSKNCIKKGRALLPTAHEITSARVRKFLKEMKKDEIVELIEKDEIIMLYASRRANELFKLRDHLQVKREMRLIGQIYSEVQKQHKTSLPFIKFIDRDYTKYFENAFYCMIEFDEATNTMKKCHKVNEIIFLFRKLIDFIDDYFNEKKQDEKREEIKSFGSLIVKRFMGKVKLAESLKLKQSRSKKVLIPDADDYEKLFLHVEKIRKTAFHNLKTKYSDKSYSDLATSTMVLLQIFNARRQGEINHMEIEDYDEQYMLRIQESDKEFKALDPDCQQIVCQYIRLRIPGKRDMRNVGLLIHQNLKTSIDLLLEKRERAGIHKKNPYIFAKKINLASDNHRTYQAYKELEKYAKNCGAKCPETLKGTAFRRQIAHYGAHSELSGNQLQIVCNFLGHKKSTHQNFYSITGDNEELIQMSTVLTRARASTSKTMDASKSHSTSSMAREGIVCSFHKFSSTFIKKNLQ